MRTLQAPEGFVKMADGRVLPASRMSTQQKQKPKKFLIVLGFYEGDRDAAEQLASLIADLERTRNHEADFMLMRRADCRELSATVKAKLETKFDRVIPYACRRADAKGYPFGANQMWSDLITLMAQVPPFATDYYAFINLEADAVPTRPGWIGELIAGWKDSMAQNKPAMGHMHDNPVNHLNGLAVYSSDMYRRVASNRLLGSSPQTCYDIYFANFLRPHASDSPLIYFSYRQETITPEELFAPRKQGIVPALYHGVKNGTARAAVRARHISFTDKAPVFIQHEPKQTLQVSEVHDPLAFTPDKLESGEEMRVREVSLNEVNMTVSPRVMREIFGGGATGTKPLGVSASIQAEQSAVAAVNAKKATLASSVMGVVAQAQALSVQSFLPPGAPAQALGVSASIQAEEKPSLLEQHEFPDSRRKVPDATPKRPNVYTYYSARGRQSNETQAILELWRKGWASRGWNPVVLTLRDAAKHPKFDDMATALERLPYAGDRKQQAAAFNRWLALDVAGGGLMVDLSAFPAELVPAGIDERSPVVFMADDSDYLLGLNLIGADAGAWVESIAKYDAQPTDLLAKKPHVTDAVIARVAFADDHLSESGLTRVVADGTERTSVAMEKFLTGVTV